MNLKEPKTVTRYVVTMQRPGDLRQLAHPAQGRATYATPEEAQAWIEGALANNSHDTLRSVYGPLDALQVRPCTCWAGHFDPVGVYFDE